MKKYLSKPLSNYKVLFVTILLMIFILVIVCQLLSMGYQKLCPINTNEKSLLENKFDMVLTDFNNIKELEGVSVEVRENQMEFIFSGDECDLEVITNNDFDVISKEFNDNRFLAQSSNIFLLGIGGFVLAALFALWTSVLLDLFAYFDRKKKQGNSK